MKGKYFTGILCCAALLLAGGKARAEEPAAYKRESRIQDVIRDSAFGDYGRLLFPVDDLYYRGNTLEELRLVYYSHIDPDKTVEIVNTLRDRWYDLPTPVWSFLEKYDLSGKTIIPFFYHNGSSSGANSLNRLTELAKEATVRTDDALSIRGNSVAGSEHRVKEWAASFVE